MRLILVCAVFLGQVVSACAGFLVDFGSGDRMVVDDYREDGDWVHLRRGGEALTVPRARVRGVFDDSHGGSTAPGAAKPATRPASR